MKDKKQKFKEIVAVSRGEIVENTHYGAYCIAGKSNEILYSFGDPSMFVFTRSTAKPFQALPVILSGAYTRYNFTSKEIAVICSSHFAQDEHIQQVNSILNKIGLSEKDLLTPSVYSRNNDIRDLQISQGIKPSKIFSDCSGKHSGMLSVCLTKGYPIKNYVDPSHPLQKEILKIISVIYATKDIKLGVDGCSAPVFAVPFESMAKSYQTLIMAKLNNVQREFAKEYGFDIDQFESALKIIRNSMLSNPEMIAGNSGLCTLLTSIYGGTAIAKVGAGGVYCIGINDFITKNSIGIALKISDGSIPIAEYAITSILYRLNLLPSTRSEFLNSILFKKNLNEHKVQIGEYYFLDDNLPLLSSLI